MSEDLMTSEPNYTLKQITDALQISRTRVEQWISREFFRTPHKPIFGAAREWQIGDAIRLAVCAELVDMGLSPETAGKLAAVWVGLHGFKNDVAYLVVSAGNLGEVVPPTPRGSPGTKKGGDTKVHVPGVLYEEIVKATDLTKVLDNPDRHVSIVISVDNLENRVKEALGYTR